MAMQQVHRQIPLIVIDNLKKKQMKMQDELFRVTGKRKRIPLSKVLIAVSSKPLYITEKELKQLTKLRTFRI